MLEFLSDYRLPDLSNLSIVSCGSHLAKVKTFLMNSMPYETHDFILNTRTVDLDDDDYEVELKQGEEEGKEINRDGEMDEQRYDKPTFEFVDQLCEAISLYVTDRVIVKGLELTTLQFCSLITAADCCSYIAVIGNKIEDNGAFKLPYSELRNLKQLFLSDNNLSYEQIRTILGILESLNCLSNLIYIDMQENNVKSKSDYDRIVAKTTSKYENLQFR